PAAAPLERLLADADRAGLGFKIASAFRSYDYQLAVHAAHVAERGRAGADRVSARAGHSEHQTGLAVDLVTPADPACDFEECFADTPGGRWLADEAWRYGFVVRYQAGSTDVTGYAPEPWHLRYVGRELAAELRRTGIPTLEELFDISGGDYP
ncbi:MAG TPA: M15 family metallopeptidase, partial [Nocardioides sp.]|nr:M15 family metallopeptidase [Nocardioides sp.]